MKKPIYWVQEIRKNQWWIMASGERTGVPFPNREAALKAADKANLSMCLYYWIQFKNNEWFVFYQGEIVSPAFSNKVAAKKWALSNGNPLIVLPKLSSAQRDELRRKSVEITQTTISDVVYAFQHSYPNARRPSGVRFTRNSVKNGHKRYGSDVVNTPFWIVVRTARRINIVKAFEEAEEASDGRPVVVMFKPRHTNKILGVFEIDTIDALIQKSEIYSNQQWREAREDINALALTVENVVATAARVEAGTSVIHTIKSDRPEVKKKEKIETRVDKMKIVPLKKVVELVEETLKKFSDRKVITLSRLVSLVGYSKQQVRAACKLLRNQNKIYTARNGLDYGYHIVENTSDIGDAAQ